MLNLNDLQSAKTRALKAREYSSENAYDKALNLFDSFSQNPSMETLEESAKKFTESIQLNKNHYPSYFCLSYIFYVLDNNEFALKYLEKAEELCEKKIPDEFIAFRNKIISDENIQELRIKNSETDKKEIPHVTIGNKDVSMPIPVKAVVSKTSNFWRAIQQEAITSSKQVGNRTNINTASRTSSRELENFEKQKQSSTSFLKSLKF